MQQFELPSDMPRAQRLAAISRLGGAVAPQPLFQARASRESLMRFLASHGDWDHAVLAWAQDSRAAIEVPRPAGSLHPGVELFVFLCEGMKHAWPMFDPFVLAPLVLRWAEEKWVVLTMPDGLRVLQAQRNAELLHGIDDGPIDTHAAQRAQHAMIIMRVWGTMDRWSTMAEDPMTLPTTRERESRLLAEPWLSKQAFHAVTTLSCLQFLWLRPRPARMTAAQPSPPWEAMQTDEFVRGHWVAFLVKRFVIIPSGDVWLWQDLLLVLRDAASCLSTWPLEMAHGLHAALCEMVPYPTLNQLLNEWTPGFEWWSDPRILHVVHWTTVWVICGAPIPDANTPAGEPFQEPYGPGGVPSTRAWALFESHLLAAHVMLKVRQGRFWGGFDPSPTLDSARDRVVQLAGLPAIRVVEGSGRAVPGPAIPRDHWLATWMGASGTSAANALKRSTWEQWGAVIEEGGELVEPRSMFDPASWGMGPSEITMRCAIEGPGMVAPRCWYW